METKYWTLDLISMSENIVYRTYSGRTFSEASSFAEGLAMMYDYLKGSSCGAVIYDENDERSVPKIYGKVNIPEWREELWRNAILKERSEAQRAAI